MQTYNSTIHSPESKSRQLSSVRLTRYFDLASAAATTAASSTNVATNFIVVLRKTLAENRARAAPVRCAATEAFESAHSFATESRRALVAAR